MKTFTNKNAAAPTFVVRVFKIESYLRENSATFTSTLHRHGISAHVSISLKKSECSAMHESQFPENENRTMYEEIIGYCL